MWHIGVDTMGVDVAVEFVEILHCGGLHVITFFCLLYEFGT